VIAASELMAPPAFALLCDRATLCPAVTSPQQRISRQRSAVMCCSERSDEVRAHQRRELLLGAGLAAAAVIVPARSAVAKDIPLFGLKKKAEDAVKATSDAASAAVDAAESAVEGVTFPTVSLSPGVQAGAVVAAEIVAVGVAGLVVGSVTSK